MNIIKIYLRAITKHNPGNRKTPGYSIVESLVSLALLTAVLLPVCLLFGRITHTQLLRNHSTAQSLAGSEMEKTILDRKFIPEMWTVKIRNRVWQFERLVEIEGGLVEVTVRVKPKRNEQWTYSVKTCRLLK